MRVSIISHSRSLEPFRFFLLYVPPFAHLLLNHYCANQLPTVPYQYVSPSSLIVIQRKCLTGAYK